MSAFNSANVRDLVGGWSCVTLFIGLARAAVSLLLHMARDEDAAKRAAWQALNRTPLNLASAPPVIPKENILLVETNYDLFVGKEGIEDLWEQWGRPDIWRLPHGHVSKALLPGLTGRILRWLGPRLSKSPGRQGC